MKKIGRNDPCSCGSGKKFKKCCEGNLLGSKKVIQITTGLDSQENHSKLSSLFQNLLIQ